MKPANTNVSIAEKISLIRLAREKIDGRPKTPVVTVLLSSLLLFVSSDSHANSRPMIHGLPSGKTTSPISFQAYGIRNWYLVGNSLTPGQNILQARIVGNAAIRSVEVRLDNRLLTHWSRTGSDFGGSIDISSLAPGKHLIQIIPDGNAKSAWKHYFYRSHPLYVLLTTDWDTSDSRDSVLKLHEALHKEHPLLKITHFLGPYTFTDPKVSSTRHASLVKWMSRMRTSFQDEIALHIHPYCNFVNTVTHVHCRFKPSDTYSQGDSSGYTVLSSAYSEAEYLRLLRAADTLFHTHGLSKPTSFRAGSWAADSHILKALALDGFVADSSANNWIRIKEESQNDGNGILYKWNQRHWRAINDRSQPYYPNEFEAMSNRMPAIPILEVPDNGSLVDYVTSQEMISIFNSNWHGQPLAKPRTYVFGFHPVSYGKTFHKRIQKTLSYIDRFLENYDQGPVVYETLSHMARVFH